MTIERLKQYTMMVREVKQLEGRIGKYASQPERYTQDSVTGSSPEFPYTSRTVVIHGQDQKYREKLEALQTTLMERQSKVLDEMLEIETFVDRIESSEIRQIITLKYIEGQSWSQTAMIVYGHPERDAVRMKVKRFFEKK